MIKYFLLLLPLTAFAGGSHHHETITTLTGQSEGVALGLASAQHNFDFGTHSWQGSMGAGGYGDESAVSFGVAKRLDRVLVNGSFGMENGKSGFGVGVSWRF